MTRSCQASCSLEFYVVLTNALVCKCNSVWTIWFLKNVNHASFSVTLVCWSVLFDCFLWSYLRLHYHFYAFVVCSGSSKSSEEDVEFKFLDHFCGNHTEKQLFILFCVESFCFNCNFLPKKIERIEILFLFTTAVLTEAFSYQSSSTRAVSYLIALCGRLPFKCCKWSSH